jgi:hypothetical protein
MTRAIAWTACVLVLAGGLSRRSGEAAKADAPFDLAAIENGGRVEWASSEFFAGNVAANLVSGGARYWSGDGNAPDRREEIVFSFFSRQSALVAGVQINPFTPDANDRPKDVEVWTSMQSSTTGFVRAGAVTLKKEDALQSIDFPPVEAKYVTLRILNAYAALPGSEPGGYAIGASRVKILEGSRAGYTPVLARNPELASVLKGVMPGAPPPAPSQAAVSGMTCAAPVADAPPRKSTFAQSRNVLVVANRPQDYKTFAWKFAVNDTTDMSDRAVIDGVTFGWVTPTALAPAQLVAEPKVDTVVFAQVCGISDDLTAASRKALFAWVAAGHKLLIQDSDVCAGNDAPHYPFMPYPFATVNPGAAGAAGVARILENSTLASSNPRDAGYIDVDSWMAGVNDLGDSNVVVEYDAHWCGAMWAQNKLGKNGFALAYAHYGRGLIVYDGVDSDQSTKPSYIQLQRRELMQPVDADYLACSQPLGGFIVATAKAGLKSQPMAVGHTYTYPLSVLGNYGYSGKVTLDAGVLPADPNITVKLDRASVDLTKTEEASASLTVTTAPTASLASKVVAVRGKDAAGKSNVLCLDLPERTTGGLTVLSALQKDKKPTKNIEIILDASGSMKTLLGKKTRWATAIDVLNEVVGKLPTDYSVGLRTYGHRESSLSPKTCTDTELVAPVQPLDRNELMTVARALRPRGETPLVYSILQTPGDLQEVGGGSVILITDGEESCKGDIAAAAKTLKDSGVNLSLNIVGFTLKSAQAQTALGGLAQAMGGHYYAAESGTALARALLLAAVDQLPYRVLDAKGVEVDTGVAGVNGQHELPPGNYSVVVSAGDASLTVPVTLALRQDLAIRVGIENDKLVVAK